MNLLEIVLINYAYFWYNGLNVNNDRNDNRVIPYLFLNAVLISWMQTDLTIIDYIIFQLFLFLIYGVCLILAWSILEIFDYFI